MLVLTFRIAEAPFAVAVARVVEVVPRVALRKLPHAPDYLAGLLHYRGKAVPVVDLGSRIAGAPCAERLDTRIILVDFGGRETSRPGSLLGMIAERVEDVRSVDPAKSALAAADVEEAAYLGAVYRIDGVLVQMIEPERVLPGPLAGAAGGATVSLDGMEAS